MHIARLIHHECPSADTQNTSRWNIAIPTESHPQVRPNYPHAAFSANTWLHRIRQTVLKNNARLSSPTPPEDVQDQGFTRPSILVLLPMRNSALSFLQSFLDHFTSTTSALASKKTQESQIHNYARFVSEYSLPPGTEDKLGSADGGYPEDHGI
jgi:U3 small nucleolar RNA-associated protein 25